jgi:hypothetical protein
VNPAQMRRLLIDEDIDFLLGKKVKNHDKALKDLILHDNLKVRKYIKRKLQFMLADVIIEECEILVRNGKESECKKLLDENMKLLDDNVPMRFINLKEEMEHVPFANRHLF